MLEQVVTYKNRFTKKEVTETIYLDLTMADLLTIEADYEGGLAVTMQKAIEEEDTQKTVKIFQRLILDAYGQRTDGDEFVKSNELRERFRRSEAYSALLLTILKNEDKAASFFNEIMPEGLAEEVEKLQARQEEVSPAKKIIPYNEAEAMTREELMTRLDEGWSVGSR